MADKAKPTNEVALSVRDLHKSFGDKVVHEGVSFDVLENEILGLFGGSGTGKSVILRSLIGLEHPDQGEILFEGRDLMKLTERELFEVRTHISYVSKMEHCLIRKLSKRT
jgi:phospholipid/cholesterol/gamma-HCH transport system ATP-binding protein